MQPSEPKSNPGKAAPPNLDDLIIFLCPNGHKLNGPKSLQGKPGQCPHCGARFQIPSPEDVEAHEAEEIDDEFADVDDDFDLELSESVEELPDVVELESGVALDDALEDESLPDERVDLLAARASAAKGRALGAIIRALWSPRPAGAVLEIHLAGGKVLTAEKFSTRLSQHHFGVFAVRETDGSYTMTTIPWDTIRRIGVRNFKQLPGGLFD